MIEIKPTHPDVYKALKILEDTLEEMKITHFIEQDSENPDLWSVGSAEERENRPDDPVIHMGFVGLNKNTKGVSFAGYDSGHTARNEKEGITGDDGLEMVDLKGLDMMILWLTGDFHRILRSAEAKMAKMDEVAKKAAPRMAADIIASVTEGARI
jgi:hypothetical protein